MPLVRGKPKTRMWNKPAGTRWAVPFFGGYVCFVRQEPSYARELEKIMAEVNAGDVVGPFLTVEDSIKYLESEPERKPSRALLEAIEDAKEGRISKPFDSVDDLIADLNS